MNKTTQIAVVLPVYNGMSYIEESVQSVLNQTYRDFELLICDDCSTDGSYDFLQTIEFDNLCLLRNNRNLGLFSSLNILIKKAKSPLIHLWAQDDIMLPNCLEETLKFHTKFRDVNFSFSRWYVIDNQGVVLDKGFEIEDKTISPKGHAKSSILYGSIAGNIANVTVVKKAIEDAGYFNENMKYSGDFDMWCKLSKTTAVGMTAAYLIKLRRHSEQLSKNLDASYYKLAENLQIYRCFLSHFDNKELKIAKRALKWKINTQFFNQYIFIIRQRNKKLANKYLKKLKEYDNIFLLFFRWGIVRILRILNLEQKFYNKYIINKLDKSTKKIER